MRRVDSLLLSTRCTLRLPSGSRTFDVFRRATCVAFGPGADIDDRVPPIHPAMTFKYFRTRRGVPSLLPRAGRPRETRGREMDEESPPLSVLPKLASDAPRREKLDIFRIRPIVAALEKITKLRH